VKLLQAEIARLQEQSDVVPGALWEDWEAAQKINDLRQAITRDAAARVSMRIQPENPFTTPAWNWGSVFKNACT
jgi:hypothetical protein